MKKTHSNYKVVNIDEIFTSKSNVLKFLQKKIKRSKIEKIYDFTIYELKKHENEILELISKKFNSQKVVVRSSAKGEDSLKKSQAGIYESVLNIPSNSKAKVRNAISSVIRSYVEKGNKNPSNQILIQTQTQNIVTSGVIFTRSENIGAPYYIINYEEGSSTIGVTSGQIANTLKIFRKTSINYLHPKWRFLLRAINEIESILGMVSLDIEFSITEKNKIVIFQVRPIVSTKKIMVKNLDTKIEKIISKNKRKFLKLKKLTHVPGNFTIFSDMTDWNPAEIIGNNPNVLDYSLYDFLIMKRVWHEGRRKIGYQNVNPSNLMVKFGNKPYVDVRASFNSLIPENIKSNLKSKLINFYLEKLTKNPFLHDKVEFEILFSCYDFLLDYRLNELLKYNFSKSEIKKIKSSLIDFTNEIIDIFPITFNQCKNSIQKMSQNRSAIKSSLHSTKQSYFELLNAAENLLIDCKKFGTMPFSTMARIAFIASLLLKSLIKQQKINSKFYNTFMNSITTPLSEFQNDFGDYCDNRLSKKDFLQKYGHLRPGTYDIMALRYDRNAAFLDDIKFVKHRRSLLKPNYKELISGILKNCPLNFHNVDFFSFVKDALKQREELKFEFTHNLSDALEFIVKAGQKLEFSRAEMAYLDIQTILKSYKKLKEPSLKLLWQKKIERQKKEKLINDYLVLTSIIFSKNDFDVIRYYVSKPNYISSKTIRAELVILKKFTKKIPNIENKIILIENADPGFDWIFTKNPAGLITKYGGVASHMAIRCAELGLPAAIGCGDVLYDKLIKSSKIMLDCKNEQIVILEHEKADEYIEERKILKTLGYIK